MSTPRIVALAALVLIAPVLVVKLAWLVPTIKALGNAFSEISIEGTSSYVEDRGERIQRGVLALVLYIIGLPATLGLVGISIGLIRRKYPSLAVWCAVVLASLGCSVFELFTVSSGTDKTYLAVFVVVPLVVALLGIYSFIAETRR